VVTSGPLRKQSGPVGSIYTVGQAIHSTGKPNSDQGQEVAELEQKTWSAEEAKYFLEGMRAVATLQGRRPLDEIAGEMLEAVRAHVLHADLELGQLENCTPEELAQRISSPKKRRELLQFLILMPYLDMEVDRDQVAVVDEMAAALGIETDTLADLHRVRDDRLKRLLVDYTRRSLKEFIGAKTTWEQIKAFGKTFKEYLGDSKVAAQYQALADYPEGSLGHTVYHFYRARNFPLPGEKKGFGEYVIAHDCCHILGGFNTDMNGEMNVAGFEAGLYENGFGFELLLEVILDFHLGKAFSTLGILPPGTGHFDPEAVLRGYELGVDCRLNPFHDWDFWSVAREPVTKLRLDYGLEAVNGPVLMPPPASMDSAPPRDH